MSNENYVVSTFCEGESITMWSTVTKEQLIEVEKILGTDFMHNITLENPVQIKMITDKQARQSVVDGSIFDGHSQENAERIADGLEPLKELEDMQ